VWPTVTSDTGFGMLGPLGLVAAPSIVLGWLVAGPVVGLLAGVIAATVVALCALPIDRHVAAPRRTPTPR